MSSVQELYASRLTGVRGQHGAQGLTSTWHVVVDNVLDDPVTVLSLASGGVTLGSVYPWTDSFGVVAIGFSVRERWSPVSWLIDVLYGVPLVFDAPVGITPGWTFEGGGALETEEYTEDRRHINGEHKPQLVGPHRYYIAGEGDSVTHFAGGFDKDPVQLVQDDLPPAGIPGPSIPLSRQKRIGWFSAKKTLATITADQLATGYQAIGRVNSSEYMGAGIQEIIVTGFNWKGVPASTSGGSSTTAWEVRFDFTVNNDKFIDTVIDTWTDKDSGDKFPIESALGEQEVVKRVFYPYDEVNINGLLGLFN